MPCLVMIVIAAIYWMLAAIFMRVFVPAEWHWLAFMLFLSFPVWRVDTHVTR